jgi:hypothetical protein
MAAKTVAWTKFDPTGDSWTYVTAGHTSSKPKLVLCKRRVPVGNQVVSEASMQVVHATEDTDGLPISTKCAVGCTGRFSTQMGATETDLDDAITIFRDFVASDDFVTLLKSQIFPES